MSPDHDLIERRGLKYVDFNPDKETAIIDVLLIQLLRQAVSSFEVQSLQRANLVGMVMEKGETVRIYPVLRSSADGRRFVAAGEMFSEIFPATERAAKDGKTILLIDWGSNVGEKEYSVGGFFSQSGFSETDGNLYDPFDDAWLYSGVPEGALITHAVTANSVDHEAVVSAKYALLAGLLSTCGSPVDISKLV